MGEAGDRFADDLKPTGFMSETEPALGLRR